MKEISVDTRAAQVYTPPERSGGAMIISPRIRVSSTLLVLAALTLGVASVRAACPDSPCDCLGEASSYRVVALDSLGALVGGPPYAFLRGSRIEGRACAFTAKLTMAVSNWLGSA